MIDGMKKEGKLFRNLMVIAYIFAALTPFLKVLDAAEKYSVQDIVLMTLYCFMFGTIGLYGWLYSLKYKVIITSEKVELFTLFTKCEIELMDVEYYTCKQYRRSAFYQFKLYTGGKAILINTRFHEQLTKILDEHGANRRTIK